MTKIDIVSGFLGAGKTTLIKKMLKEALADQKVVLIENEFGEIGIDGGFLKEAGIEIKEMNSGCICCSLVGDFGSSLQEVITAYAPERILIEPSGVGKLSDVMKAVQAVTAENEVILNSATAVVDAAKCKMYVKNFGEFFINQIENAGTVILSRTGKLSAEKLSDCIALIRKYNEKAAIVTTPWEEVDGMEILKTMEGAADLKTELMQEVMKHHHHDDHSHHGHCHDENCHGEHHHDNEYEHDEHEHDEHEHDEHCHDEHCHHEHEHDEHCHDEHCHHENDEHCCNDSTHEHHGEGCNCGHHEHDAHHHADEVFMSWGMETALSYTADEIKEILEKLEVEGTYGFVLRAKGMVSCGSNWIYFDYVPGEIDIREGKADVTGKICVIGSKLKEENLITLFKKPSC